MGNWLALGGLLILASLLWIGFLYDTFHRRRYRDIWMVVYRNDESFHVDSVWSSREQAESERAWIQDETLRVCWFVEGPLSLNTSGDPNGERRRWERERYWKARGVQS